MMSPVIYFNPDPQASENDALLEMWTDVYQGDPEYSTQVKREKCAKHTFFLPSEHWGRILKSKDVKHLIMNLLAEVEPH